MTHRKIGGIHWFTIGRLCISVCITKPKRVAKPKRQLTLVAAGATASRPALPHISEGPMV